MLVFKVTNLQCKSATVRHLHLKITFPGSYSNNCTKQLNQQVSGMTTMTFSVASLVHFYSHNRFVPSNVCAPVLLLALTGLAACLVAALGWFGAMAGNTCRLYTVREVTLQQKLNTYLPT
jgi:hypothetical protein